MVHEMHQGKTSGLKAKFWSKKKKRARSPSPDVEMLDDDSENEDENEHRKKVRWEGNVVDEEKKSNNATSTSEVDGSETEPQSKVLYR